MLKVFGLDVNVHINKKSLLSYAVDASSLGVITYIITNESYDPVNSQAPECLQALITSEQPQLHTLRALMAGVDINTVFPNGQTALSLSIRHPECMDVILERKDVDVNKKIGKLEEPVLIQIAKGGCNVPDSLIAREDLDVNAQDASGDTALMLFIRRQHVHAVKLLVERKHCRLDIKNNNGVSAVEILQEQLQKLDMDSTPPSSDAELRVWIGNMLHDIMSKQRLLRLRKFTTNLGERLDSGLESNFTFNLGERLDSGLESDISFNVLI